MSTGTEPPLAEGPLTEWLLRGFALLLMALIVMRWGHAWLIDPSRWTALLLLVSEGYTLMLVLLARRASQRDLSAVAMVATIYATCCAVLLTPQNTIHLVPEGVGVALQLVSMGWQFTAKIVLGRSFGLLPAQRGIVTVGPYRIVRHPIYCGYLIGHIGFLAANFSWRNAIVLVLLYVAQVVRILREEAMLAGSDANYRNYQQQVRWRILPFVF